MNSLFNFGGRLDLEFLQKEFIAVFNHKVNRDLSFNIYVQQKKKKKSNQLMLPG